MGSAPVRAIGALTVALAWVVYVWFTGRTWRHRPVNRRVTRPVRATLQTAGTAVVAALIWRPVATAVALAVAGVALVTTATLTRHQPAQIVSRPPIRVRAHYDPQEVRR